MPAPKFDPTDLATWAKALLNDHARGSGEVAHQIANRTWVDGAVAGGVWGVLQNMSCALRYFSRWTYLWLLVPAVDRCFSGSQVLPPRENHSQSIW